jgi:hypothetical protein
LIGLWMLIHAVEEFRAVLDIRLGLFEPKTYSAGSYLFSGVMYAAIGLYLLGWSQRLARFVCCRPIEEPQEADEESDTGDKASGPGKQS